MHIRYLLVTAGAIVAACDASSDAEVSEPLSAQARLSWKRSAVVERDVAAALELPVEDVCRGLAGEPCVSDLYLVSLGGNEPYVAGMYVPVDRPLVTTPIAVERVLLAACSHRAALDTAVAEPVVFGSLDLGGLAPAADSQAVSELVKALMRRLHARDPDADEVALVGRLVEDDDGTRLPATEFALLACYAIASTTEFLFF